MYFTIYSSIFCIFCAIYFYYSFYRKYQYNIYYYYIFFYIFYLSKNIANLIIYYSILLSLLLFHGKSLEKSLKYI